MDRAKATADLELEMESRTRRAITCNHSLLTMLQPVLGVERTQRKALAQGAFKIEATAVKITFNPWPFLKPHRHLKLSG